MMGQVRTRATTVVCSHVDRLAIEISAFQLDDQWRAEREAREDVGAKLGRAGRLLDDRQDIATVVDETGRDGQRE